MDTLAYWILLACVTQVEAVMKLEPRTLTVLRGNPARFTCSTDQAWKVMLWSLPTGTVLTISADYGILSISPNMTANDRSTGSRSSWELVLESAEHVHRGLITCELQNIKKETATLFVQETGTVGITGSNVTALKGQRVVFECQAAGWYPEPSLVWRVNGRQVDKAEYNISTGVSEEGLYNLTSDLCVEALESSHVDCLASVPVLPMSLVSSVRLTVLSEVLVEENDCTTLFAVAVSVSTIFLLLLLSLCIVLCSRRRKRAKSSQADAVRTDESESRRSSVAEATIGKVNLGYATEVLTDICPSDLNQKTYSQMESFSTNKTPDVVFSIPISLQNHCSAHIDLEDQGSKSVRRVTTV